MAGNLLEMDTKFLYYPLKSWTLIQGFGSNPAYYAKFLDKEGNPVKGHMGLDVVASHGTPLYAACEGMAFYVSDDHGGDGIYISALVNGQGFYVINWHLCSKDDSVYKPLIPTDGSWTPVKAGQLIGYTDNTGAPFESSGDHLHLGLAPLSPNGAIADPLNGYGGCVDPISYFNGLYAPEITEPPTQHYTFMSNLLFGQTSVDILNLQKVLQEKGFFPSNVDPTGFYGSVTALSVLKFRVAYGVSSDTDSTGHSVGPLTREALNKL